MKKMYLLLIWLISASEPLLAMGNADPLVSTLYVDELQKAEGGEIAWDIEYALGHDLHKFWLISEGEKEGQEKDIEVSLLYGFAISPYWDFLFGGKQYTETEPKQSWLEFHFKGLAPYFIESDIVLLVNDKEQAVLRLDFEQEWRLSQRWELIPELSFSVASYDDFENNVSSGLYASEIAFKFAYDINRQCALYLGISREDVYGELEDFYESEESSDSAVFLGIKAVL